MERTAGRKQRGASIFVSCLRVVLLWRPQRLQPGRKFIERCARRVDRPWIAQQEIGRKFLRLWQTVQSSIVHRQQCHRKRANLGTSLEPSVGVLVNRLFQILLPHIASGHLCEFHGGTTGAIRARIRRRKLFEYLATAAVREGRLGQPCRLILRLDVEQLCGRYRMRSSAARFSALSRKAASCLSLLACCKAGDTLAPACACARTAGSQNDHAPARASVKATTWSDATNLSMDLPRHLARADQHVAVRPTSTSRRTPSGASSGPVLSNPPRTRRSR